MSTPGQFVGNGIQVYVPLLELSGNLQVEFGRATNSQRAKLNGYTKQVVTNGLRGNYVYFNPEENARLGRNLGWAQNSPRPTGRDNGIAFDVRQFELKRYEKSTVLDTDTLDVSNLALQKMTTASLAQIMMANRVRTICNKITTSGNFPTAHVKTAATLGGYTGFIDQGTPADPRIMTVVQEAKAIIQAATFGRFTDGELGFLCNPKTARKLARTRELREFVSNQVGSFEILQGKSKKYNGGYLLQPFLYDTQVIVEDTMYTDDLVNKTGTEAEAASFAFPDNTALVFARPGDLNTDEAAAGQDFATFTQFVYKGGDMVVESMTDAWNHQQYFGVMDWFDIQITSPISAVLITNLFS